MAAAKKTDAASDGDKLAMPAIPPNVMIDPTDEAESEIARREQRRAAVEAVCKLDPIACEEEFVKLPGVLSAWIEDHAQAVRAKLRANVEKGRVAARLFLTYRERILAAGERPTEALVEAYVESDPEMVAAHLTAIDYEVTARAIDGAVEGLRGKKDALVNVAANVRSEMQGDPTMRVAASEERRRRAGA